MVISITFKINHLIPHHVLKSLNSTLRFPDNLGMKSHAKHKLCTKNLLEWLIKIEMNWVPQCDNYRQRHTLKFYYLHQVYISTILHRIRNFDGKKMSQFHHPIHYYPYWVLLFPRARRTNYKVHVYVFTLLCSNSNIFG